MTPDRSSARSRRWHGETLRRTRSASSVSVSRPSCCSSARICRSMSSMHEIFPPHRDSEQEVGSTFARFRPNVALVPEVGAHAPGGTMPVATIAAFWAVSLVFVVTPGADWAYAITAGLRHRTVLPAVGGLLAGHLAATALVAAGV